MQYTLRAMILFSSMLIFCVVFSGPLCAQQNTPAHHAHETPNPQSGSNPLIEEMMTLDNAYKEVVLAIALGDSERVHKALAAMQGTMEKTHEGVHSGAVAIPKNAKRIKDFMNMDRKFHDKLETLDRAARHNNQREMLRITKQLLDGCVQCHKTFRK